MGRGLDGYFSVMPVFFGWLCSFEGLRGDARPAGRFQRRLRPPGLDNFPVAIARGKHLFPFRTEQLSPAAPMVLGPQGPGRVGRRRFLHQRAAHVGGS
jgi:hypothetical protein